MEALNYFRKHSNYGVLFLRVAIGVFLIYGVLDNILSWERMLEFRDFLQAHGMPFPLFSAHVSVYVQFACGLMLLLGAAVRLAGILMIVNFLVAIVLVHLGQNFPEYYPAAQLIAVGFFFLFNGAGPVSVDALWEDKTKKTLYRQVHVK
ncbi:DoxX family protein [Pontibacter sp. H259]|uniref:DoxX family protein n=1 Tax=Pontibacter sp. H259 TaxID=3133421 RepID=UPI0030C34249